MSHHYNLRGKVQIVGVNPNGMLVNKLPSKVLFGKFLLNVGTYESCGSRGLRKNYLEARKRINAETIVPGWLTVRSCPPPSTVMSSE